MTNMQKEIDRLLNEQPGQRYGLLRWQQSWYARAAFRDQVRHRMWQWRRRLFGVRPVKEDNDAKA